jgi:hypothetical protein
LQSPKTSTHLAYRWSSVRIWPPKAGNQEFTNRGPTGNV